MIAQKLVHKSDKTVTPGSIMERIGNIDPITYGGGVIFQTSHGPYLEFTEGVEAT